MKPTNLTLLHPAEPPMKTRGESCERWKKLRNGRRQHERSDYGAIEAMSRGIPGRGNSKLSVRLPLGRRSGRGAEIGDRYLPPSGVVIPLPCRDWAAAGCERVAEAKGNSLKVLHEVG